jgi:hypothetical protein
LERGVFALPWIDLQQLAARKPVALRPRLAVHLHRAIGQQSLGFGTGCDLRQRCDEPIEPLAGSLGRYAQTDRQRRASPSRIAAKRMPTPTTMKVSARLKAGQ